MGFKTVGPISEKNGRVESFIVLIHVVGLNGQLSVFPPHVANLKALRFLLEAVDLGNEL